MPHIHRIRVNNVKYNFGTQFFDDFIMRFDGKNALYDLANGGGKSVLLLLLFQNLIPNCSLDDKQPVEKLFRTGDGSTSIHSLIEWKLDAPDVKDGFKYMLTGFCARKAKNDGEASATQASAAIDYFNYVIFYRAYNDNDLVNLPLSRGRERMTYTGLRTYLKELEHKDYHLKVHIFDRKGAYQSFISQYGLYESQWEIIRGINKTEGHVRTYFETHYKTTRKVVEDLLIEEIIQKAYAGKTGGGDEDMAKTLMMIRDKLLELSKKRREIISYDRQTQALERFAGRIHSLTKLYDAEDDFRYHLVRGYNGLLEAIRAKARDGAACVKEQGFAQNHLREMERRLDTVKVQQSQEQLKQAVSDASKAEERLRVLEADYANAAMKLSEAESMRDFLEYEENRKEAEIVKGAIDKAGEDPKGYRVRLRHLALLGKQKLDEEAHLIRAQLETVSENLRKMTAALDEKQELLRQAEMIYAVAEHGLLKAGQEEKQLAAEISALRHQVNALLVEGSEKEVRAYKIKEKQLKAQIEQTKLRHAQLTEEIQNTALQIEQNRVKASAGDSRKKVIADFFDAYSRTQAKADHLLKVYGADSYDVLKQHIFDRYKKTVQDLPAVTGTINDLKYKKAQLLEKNPVPVTQSVLQVMAYIRRCHHASCIAGADYLKELPDCEKAGILEKMPFLPYAVIVYTEFDKICRDHAFRTMDFGGQQTMLVRFDAVVSGTIHTDAHQMLFTSRDKALFYDDSAIEREIRRIDQEMAQCAAQEKRLADQELTYREDLDALYDFLDTYYERRLALIAEKDRIEKELAQCQKEIQRLTKQMEADQADDEKVMNMLASLNAQAADAAVELQAVESIGTLNRKLSEVRNQCCQYQQQKNHAECQKADMIRDIETISAQKHAAKKQSAVYEGRLGDLKTLWQDVFAAYYVAGEELDLSATEPEAGLGTADSGMDKAEGDNALQHLSLSETEIRFRALKQVCEAENSDMEDKKKLLETYERHMEHLACAMNARNISLAQMQGKKAEGHFVACDIDTIENLRAKMARLDEDIHRQKVMVSDALANQYQLTGRVENAVHVIEEKYGEYKAVDLKNMDFDGFIREYKASFDALKEKMYTLAKNLEKNQKEQRVLEDVKKDMERLMRSAAVTAAYTKDSDRSDSHFRQKLSELSERYECLRKEEELQKAAFEKDRDKLVEALRLLKAFDLADEIRYQVELPSTVQEASALSENISDTVKLIMLEKERVEKGIEDMQKIKENFERQCIQRCTDIKTELDRLPKMSKITLNDTPVQMIGLKIPYIKEAFYGQKMSEYIDRIAEKSDTISDEDERLKYLRNQLAWKHLFSVIVTDMDQIRLSLYKRERIREQSRFLKYEEAVGSTGQSQGIYIQFLIAVINYISAIHSKSNDTADLKKVIFIDNPFGAARDIYIWEPIFALLKENHVQLIVPARGASPAITGKFDVNYTLGQKVIGTRQQTVVIDYHSSVDIETMEYKSIEYEQQVFDFV